MEKDSLSFNRKNQSNNNIINIEQCTSYKSIDELVNMCSNFLDCTTYSVSFSPCEIEKKLDVSTTVGCNYCNKPIPKNDCLSTPCNCVHEVFIDASKCKEYSHCHSDDHSSYYSYDHSEYYSEDYSEDDYRDHLCNSELDCQDINKEEKVSDNNVEIVVQDLIEATEDLHERKADSSLTISDLTPLSYIKNSSNKASSKDEPNEKKYSKKHKDSKQHKHHKHNKRHKHY